MKRKERVDFIKYLKAIVYDEELRTFLSSTISFFVTVSFTCYNVFLGIVYGAAWNIGIAVYYALLVGVRAYILFSEKRLHKSALPDEQRELARTKLFFVQSIFLFLIALALIAPISLMVMQQKDIHYTTIPAITTAAYTTYKIIISTRNYIKNRKRTNLSVQMLKNINFVDSLMSVLTLQYTLIMTFGSGIEGEMLTLCATISFVLWGLLVSVSVLAIVKAVKLRLGR